MANRIGKVQLEFYGEGSEVPWTFGTDAIVWIDGRWGQSRAVEYLTERAREYCDAYNSRASRKIEWRGSVYLLNSRNRSITV